jgi:hypothetical protein
LHARYEKPEAAELQLATDKLGPEEAVE